MRFPRMIWAGLAVLAVDLVLLTALLTAPGSQFGSLLFQLGTFVGAWGGMEALHWVATRSPWRIAGWDEPEGRTLGERMSQVPWGDRSWLRSAVLRLLSGAVVVFGVCLLVVMFTSPPAGEARWFILVPYLLAVLQVLRLAAAGVSAMVLAPILLYAVGDRRPTAADRFHGVLAGTISMALVGLIYLRAGCPPVDRFLFNLLLVALNPAQHAYALMIGGIAWWKLCWVSRWMGRE